MLEKELIAELRELNKTLKEIKTVLMRLPASIRDDDYAEWLLEEASKEECERERDEG